VEKISKGRNWHFSEVALITCGGRSRLQSGLYRHVSEFTPQRWARARQEASAFGWTRSKAKAAHKIARKMESAALTMSGLPRLWNLTVCEATDANRTYRLPDEASIQFGTRCGAAIQDS